MPCWPSEPRPCKAVRPGLLLACLLLSLSQPALTQEANHEATQRAILQTLEHNLPATEASNHDIAMAAKDLAFSMEGDLEANLRQVMVSLGELTRAGHFPNAPRHGDQSPPARFYSVVLNVASSNYHGLNTQDIIRLTAALRDGMNFLNNAESQAITRQ